MVNIRAGTRGVHGTGLVGLREFFDPTHHGESKKIQPNPTHHISLTQPNPTHMGWVASGWTHEFDKLLLLLLLLLLNWVKKNVNINILKKPKDYYQCNSLKANNTNNQTIIVIY